MSTSGPSNGAGSRSTLKRRQQLQQHALSVAFCCVQRNAFRRRRLAASLQRILHRAIGVALCGAQRHAFWRVQQYKCSSDIDVRGEGANG